MKNWNYEVSTYVYVHIYEVNGSVTSLWTLSRPSVGLLVDLSVSESEFSKKAKEVTHPTLLWEHLSVGLSFPKRTRKVFHFHAPIGGLLLSNASCSRIRHPDMLSILNFMYNGEVNVNQEDLQNFLAAAEELKIKGLSQVR